MSFKVSKWVASLWHHPNSSLILKHSVAWSNVNMPINQNDPVEGDGYVKRSINSWYKFKGREITSEIYMKPSSNP